jgi:2-oxo-4-hydroxy-4-carboxy-5-ureidoimidazoline decarboxylase
MVSMNVERLSLSQLNTMDRAAFLSRVGWVYEHSPWVAQGAWEGRPFATMDDLCAAMERAVHSATPQQQLALIQAHPDLAGRLSSVGELTPASHSEQAEAGLHQLTVAETELLARNNALYREKFGFPFVLCVRLNNAGAILEAFSERLENTRAEEIGVALAEISKIARLRLADVIL